MGWWYGTFCYGKSPFLMGESTISMGHFMVMINEKPRNYWLVVWDIWIIFPFSWECHHPN